MLLIVGKQVHSISAFRRVNIHTLTTTVQSCSDASVVSTSLLHKEIRYLDFKDLKEFMARNSAIRIN